MMPIKQKIEQEVERHFSLSNFGLYRHIPNVNGGFVNHLNQMLDRRVEWIRIRKTDNASSSDLTISSLRSFLKTFTYEPDNKTPKPISVDECIDVLNQFFHDKRLPRQSELAYCLSAFFSVYRTLFFKLNKNIQHALTLVNPWYFFMSRLATKLPQLLDPNANWAIKEKALNTNPTIINTPSNFEQFILHALNQFHSKYCWDEIVKIDAYNVLMICREHLSKTHWATWCTTFLSLDYVHSIDFEALIEFKEFIPPVNRAAVITRLIDHLKKSEPEFLYYHAGLALIHLFDVTAHPYTPLRVAQG
jgi:hypothetical protein